MPGPASQPNSPAATNAYNPFAAGSDLAQASIAKDLEIDPEDSALDREESALENGSPLQKTTSNRIGQGYSMAGSYRRQSFIAMGQTRSTVVPSSQYPDTGYLTQRERDAAREDERSLLRDNQVILPKHPRKSSDTSGGMAKISKLLRRKSRNDEEAAVEPSGSATEIANETTPLVGGDPSLPYGGEDSPEQIDKKWEEAVEAGKIQTTWQREAKVLGRYSWSLILTFVLQYSLPLASVFTVGHLGTIELGAVSLGSMTANITGYAVFQGLATSLDTLCAQAYGSGHKHLVGLQMQRMICFLWICCIPIGVIWFSGGTILSYIVPEKETAQLAG